MELLQSYPFYWYFLIGWILVAIITFPYLLKVDAPYGRFTRKGWGSTVNNRLGWILMELPAVLTITYFFISGVPEKSITNWVFLGIWQLHYLHRTFIFPFRIPNKSKPMPWIIVISGMLFNVGNGYLNGFYLGTIAPNYAFDWMIDMRFILGANLFLIGMFVNIQSDSILFSLRKPGDKSYRIPKGGWYQYVSSPNYLGEIIEWIGWAMMIWALPGLTFALWTAANLIPRAIANHKWYKTHFENYPKNRKAIIPFVV